MIRGLYTSALGLTALNRQHEATANNLANVNTAGYKKDRLATGSFPEVLLSRLNDPEAMGPNPSVGEISLGVKVEEIFTDYSAGAKRQCENPLSLAIEGEGFFVVQTPQGERYTKNGEFVMDAAGKVVTADGYALQGEKGDLVLANADFQVDREGRVLLNGTKIDRLRIARFDTPLTKEGSSLFAGENPVTMDRPVICQGFTEESNVQPVEEMIKMVEIMRSYEANQKVMQTIDSTLDKAVNEVGRTS